MGNVGGEAPVADGSFLEVLLDRLNVAVFLADAETGMLLHANSKALELIGRSSDEIKAMHQRELHPADSVEKYESTFRAHGAAGAAVQAEAEIIHSNGSRIPVSISASVVEADKRKVVLGVFHDLRSLREARRDLDETLNQYRQLVDLSPDGIVVHCNGKIAFVNREAMRLIGASGESELVGKPIADFVHPDSLQVVSQRVHRMLTTGKIEPLAEEVFLRLDGVPLHVEVAAGPLTFQGQPAIMAFFRDIGDRHRAEEAQRASEERYRMLVEDMLEAFFELDEHGVVTFASPAIERVTGIDARSAVGLHFAQFIHPDDLSELQASFSRVLGGDLHPSEYRVTLKDGGYRWVRSSSRPVLAQGRVVGLRGMLVDITERREAEEALQRSARRLAVLHEVDQAILAARSAREISATALRLLRQQIGADRAAIIVFEPARGEGEFVAVDAEPDLLDVSGTRLPFGDFQASELGNGQSMYVPDLHAVTDRAPVGEALLARGIRSSLICNFPIEEGRVARLALSSRRVDAFTAEHRAIAIEMAGVLGVALSQSRLRERIEEQQRTLALLVAQIPDGIVLLSPDAPLLLANPAAVDYLALLGHDDLRAPLAALGGVSLSSLLTPRPGDLPHELPVTGAEPRLFEVRARATVEGTRQAWILLIHDATRERQMARSMEQQDRLAVIGHLAGGLAHDFNNYLTAILTHADLLLRDTAQTPEARLALAVIKEQSERSAKLVRSILDFSRGSASERRLLDLARFVAEVAQILARMIPERIRIELDCDESAGCLVLGDATQLQQVVMNVAVNARDAMPGQGVLRLGVHVQEVHEDHAAPVAGMAPGRWVRLSVEDNGSGIAPEHLPHIFEPFFTTKPQGHGTGLGLSQVYGLVRAHGGYVRALSRVDEGTVIDIFLPPASGVPVAPRAALAEPEGGHGELIVLVEDEGEVREAIRQALVVLGYRVVAFENGQKALAHIREAESASLLLTDLTMPVMGGEELVRRVRQELPTLPVVVLTGYAAGRLDALGETAGLTVVQKPLSLIELARVVRAALSGRGVR